MVLGINPARNRPQKIEREKPHDIDVGMGRVLKALQIANAGFQVVGQLTGNDAQSLKDETERQKASKLEKEADLAGARAAQVKMLTPNLDHQTKVFDAELKKLQGENKSKDFKDVQSMRKEWNNSPITRQTRQSNVAIEKLRSSGRGDPSAAKDHSLIFNYMKTVDAGSTVREGEFATVESAGGVIDKFTIQLFNKALSGQMLTPSQRSDFLDVAENLYIAQQQQQDQYDSEYRRLATGQGFDPNDVVLNLKVGERIETPKQPTFIEEQIEKVMRRPPKPGAKPPTRDEAIFIMNKILQRAKPQPEQAPQPGQQPQPQPIQPQPNGPFNVRPNAGVMP